MDQIERLAALIERLARLVATHAELGRALTWDNPLDELREIAEEAAAIQSALKGGGA